MAKKESESLHRRKIGKKNRASGSAWERRVRLDLESKGWIVDRWGNNVEWDEDNINKPPEERTGHLVQAKPKYNPFTKGLMMSKGGFPDFIAFTIVHEDLNFVESKLYGAKPIKMYDVIGVECKSNGYLDPEEREKCKWLLENNIFSKILIAYKSREGRRVVVKYKEFDYG